jgi:hypothetical protein
MNLEAVAFIRETLRRAQAFDYLRQLDGRHSTLWIARGRI